MDKRKFDHNFIASGTNLPVFSTINIRYKQINSIF